MEGSSSSTQPLSFYGFLDRMRSPASLDLVRSIKSFIVSLSFCTPNPEIDSKKVQDFLLTMEGTLRDHQLWTDATEEEIDCAIEGLEKYVMTKLFSRTFPCSLEDAKVDKEISEKIDMLQSFLRPEHLDIPEVLHNETSWLIAVKELQKINVFKAPREKLLCILNCCRVINNLLLNASLSENIVLAGADDFLPVLIYITIKANPPQLHSNLKFIQLYRRQEKLVSEEAYYFTNLFSVKSFISDLNSKSLAMDEVEFEKSMRAARSATFAKVPQVQSPQNLEHSLALADSAPSTRNGGHAPLLMIHDEDILTGGSKYPFMQADAGELTIEDVEKLLGVYKGVVRKYTSLCKAVQHLAMPRPANANRGCTSADETK